MANRVAIFNEGKIVQLGSPAEIYEQPQSRFVADFVGSSNVLSPAFAAAHGGATKWTSLRPERIGVFPANAEVSAVQAHTDGEIKMISYQGSVTRFSIQADGMRIAAETPAESARFKEGDKVRLIWPKSAMVTMEDSA
jgi:putative spermidine/putrescine transport system ATP-binding protein